MSNYNLNEDQMVELQKMIRDRAPVIADLIGRAVTATAMHTRPSVVTVAIKIARNPDEPRLVEVAVQEKIKNPKSKFSDVTSWDETEIIVGYRVDVDQGQQSLPT